MVDSPYVHTFWPKWNLLRGFCDCLVVALTPNQIVARADGTRLFTGLNYQGSLSHPRVGVMYRTQLIVWC